MSEQPWLMGKAPMVAVAAALALWISGCQGNGPAPRRLSGAPLSAPQAQGEFAAITGKVLFAPVAQLQTQAATTDVVNSATVSLVDPGTNQTLATSLTDSSGNFQLSTAQSTGALVPVTNTIYILDAVKGLANPLGGTNYNYPGVSAPRLRTLVKWTGTDWQSISFATPAQTPPTTACGGSVNTHYITVDTTAISIMVSLRGFTSSNAISANPVTGGATCSAATFSYSGGDTDISTTSFTTVKTLVNTVLTTNNADPVGIIQYHNGTYFNLVNITNQLGGNVSTITTSGATFTTMRGITHDGNGILWIVDQSGPSIKRLDTSTGANCIFATVGGQTCTAGNACNPNCITGSFTMATPAGIVFDPGKSSSNSGFLYVAATGSSKVKKFDIGGLSVSDLAPATPPTPPAITSPNGMAFDGSDTIYWTEAGAFKKIQKYTISANTLCTMATTQNPGGTCASNSGMCSTCKLNASNMGGIQGLSVDPVKQLLYIAGGPQHTIVQFDPSTATVSLLAGNATQAGSIDGPGLGPGTATTCTTPTGSYPCFSTPNDVAFDGSGFLYVADQGNNMIRRVRISDGATITFVGQTTAGTTNGVGRTAQFSSPRFLTFDGLNIFVSDSTNAVVRKIN